jgi:hypothetical protein
MEGKKAETKSEKRETKSFSSDLRLVNCTVIAVIFSSSLMRLYVLIDYCDSMESRCTLRLGTTREVQAFFPGGSVFL